MNALPGLEGNDAKICNEPICTTVFRLPIKTDHPERSFMLSFLEYIIKIARSAQFKARKPAFRSRYIRFVTSTA
jgi:hypothetical protein